ncbi:MAG: TIGR01777 family oxidoreductase [Bdellovibrionaceae bacterium]|nr:TIGR01777 family oxidoreductase [Pseudobdellovibrionaceae bacterium]
MNVLITGASGLVGKSIIKTLTQEGHQVFALVRSPEKVNEIPSQYVRRWQYQERPDPSFIRGVDAVIHLLGESIAAKRWTEERKRQLQESRIVSTKNLVSVLCQLEPAERPKVLISTSATGYYGDCGDVEINEQSPVGSDFLAELCKQWEAETAPAVQVGMRTVTMRLGLVLSKSGGFLAKMAPVVLGDGQQWQSWVHIHDVNQFISKAISDSSMSGPYNLVAPTPVRNKEMTRTFARVRGIPLTLPAPTLALKLILGEMSTAVLAGQRVFPQRLLESGFQFQFSNLDQALRDIYGTK